MSWFRKKHIYAIHYVVHGFIIAERHFIVKAADMAEAAKKIQDKEAYPIGIIDWEILDNGK